MAEDPYADLLRAVNRWDVVGVKNALSRGADPNRPSLNNRTPLMIASTTLADPEIVRALLDGGANPNLQDVWGNTALIDATRWAKPAVISLLLERGANPNIRRSSYGKETALDMCEKSENRDVCRQIILNKQKRDFKNQMNNSLDMLSRQYARSTNITKEDWRLILFNQKLEEFCDKPEDMYKYLGALWGLSEILGVPYGDLMFRKSDLCNRLRKRLKLGLNPVEGLVLTKEI